MTAFVRLTERGTGRAVNVVRGARSAACLLYLPVKLLEVFWLDPGDPMRAESRNEVHVDSGTVPSQCLVTDIQGCDVVEPVREPLFNRPSMNGVAYLSSASLPSVVFAMSIHPSEEFRPVDYGLSVVPGERDVVLAGHAAA